MLGNYIYTHMTFWDTIHSKLQRCYPTSQNKQYPWIRRKVLLRSLIHSFWQTNNLLENVLGAPHTLLKKIHEVGAHGLLLRVW